MSLKTEILWNHLIYFAAFSINFFHLDEGKAGKEIICFVTHQADFTGNYYLQVWSQTQFAMWDLYWISVKFYTSLFVPISWTTLNFTTVPSSKYKVCNVQSIMKYLYL